MSKVFVLDTNKQPQNPVHPAEARKLLAEGKAAVWRRYPFTIILKESGTQKPDELRLKIDPGSKTTGLAIVNDGTGEIVWAGELTHRGQQIKDALQSRSINRRHRRLRNLRYRPARHLNRKTPKGWLGPSLMSRIFNIRTWVRRLRSYCPIKSLSMELVKFDTQKIQNPEIEGVEYQQGELTGYEVREYLLEKWERKCAYCDKQNTPLEIEHIIPKSKGGSNRVSNLTLACNDCNQRKGSRDVREFLAHDPKRLARVIRFAKAPLKDASVVNATRWKLYETLQMTGLPVEVGTGGRTKYNRIRCGIEKSHWGDAACVGASTPDYLWGNTKPLLIRATGRGNRQMCLMDKYGFPRTRPKSGKQFFGFQTGDMTKAVILEGKYAGTYIGKVSVRVIGKFSIRSNNSAIDANYRCFRILQKADGYAYT